MSVEIRGVRSRCKWVIHTIQQWAHEWSTGKAKLRATNNESDTHRRMTRARDDVTARPAERAAGTGGCSRPAGPDVQGYTEFTLAHSPRARFPNVRILTARASAGPVSGSV